MVVAEEASDGIQKAVFASRGDTEVRQKKKARQIKEGADIMYAQQNEKEGTKKLVYAKKNLKNWLLLLKLYSFLNGFPNKSVIIFAFVTYVHTTLALVVSIFID